MNRKGRMNAEKTIQIICFIFWIAILHGAWELGSPVNGWAQPGDATDEGLGITWLILDETKTKAGRDFFEWFNTFWEEIKGLPYTITIKEVPLAAQGTFILINVDDTRVYEQRMDPNAEKIEIAAKSAVTRVKFHLYQKLNVQKNLEEEFQY
jgi:Curli assembly protein CsgE